MSSATENLLRIGISSCLLGQEVRYDGGHKRSSLPHEKFEGLFEFVPVCPEVAIGMSIPREPIRLVQHGGGIRVQGIETSSLDVTDDLRRYGKSQAADMVDLDGYVFMKNSPSCGLFRVKVYNEAGGPMPREGRGVYAEEFCRARPDLPVEESGRLFDAVLLENFAIRAYVHARFRALRDAGVTPKSLITFHSEHKYLVMAHSTKAYQTLGRLLADLSTNLESITQKYFSLLMEALATPATRGGHANVLSHLQGYVKKGLASNERQNLARTISDYQSGAVPLLAPIILLKHHLEAHEAEYALSQVYLDPHPAFAGLRREL